MEVSLVRRAVFKERALKSTDSRVSKGAICRPRKTTEKSQERIRHGLGGFNLLAPLRNLMIRLCFP